jgi:hypothetical protein
MSSKWKIEVHFHNREHETVAVLKLPESEYCGTETIEQVVYPAMTKKIVELNWEGFGLWAGHEPIFKQTILDEVNYQRVSGSIVLDCEDHDCKWRAVMVPVIKENECILCYTVLSDANRSYPACFHSCTCTKCIRGLNKCPICRKPFRSRESIAKMSLV